MEELFKQIITKLETLPTKEDLQSIHHKLDAIMGQVATNTEMNSAIHELASTSQEHDTDIKLLKKVVSQ